jgi:hypothetical protein
MSIVDEFFARGYKKINYNFLISLMRAGHISTNFALTGRGIQGMICTHHASSGLYAYPTISSTKF